MVDSVMLGTNTLEQHNHALHKVMKTFLTSGVHVNVHISHVEKKSAKFLGGFPQH